MQNLLKVKSNVKKNLSQKYHQGVYLESRVAIKSALVVEGHQYFSICSMTNSVPCLWET